MFDSRVAISGAVLRFPLRRCTGTAKIIRPCSPLIVPALCSRTDLLMAAYRVTSRLASSPRRLSATTPQGQCFLDDWHQSFWQCLAAHARAPDSALVAPSRTGERAAVPDQRSPLPRPPEVHHRSVERSMLLSQSRCSKFRSTTWHRAARQRHRRCDELDSAYSTALCTITRHMLPALHHLVPERSCRAHRAARLSDGPRGLPAPDQAGPASVAQ